MFLPKSSRAFARTFACALAASAMIIPPMASSGPAASAPVDARVSDRLSFMGTEGKFGVYALELHTPPVTIKAFLHPSGGMFITVRSRKNPASSVTSALTLSTTGGPGTITVTAANVETRILAVDAKGNTFIGVLVNGELKMIIKADRNANIVRNITV